VLAVFRFFLRTGLPPLIGLRGASVTCDTNSFSVGNRLKSGPYSLRTTCTVSTPIASMPVKIHAAHAVERRTHRLFAPFLDSLACSSIFTLPTKSHAPFHLSASARPLRYTPDMGTSFLVSEQEYLTTSYEPDCEYGDGILRNVGEPPHGLIQTALASFLYERRKRFRGRVITELRLGIAPRKYRIPDVCVFLQPVPSDPVPGTPPFIAIEILSPEDRMSRVRKKIDEYLAFGVPYVWLIDPERRRADVYTASAIYEAKDGVLRTEDPAIEVPLAELFQAPDD
jgi:Uma2 family endonuclease